jgi:hypothetical protein
MTIYKSLVAAIRRLNTSIEQKKRRRAGFSSDFSIDEKE